MRIDELDEYQGLTWQSVQEWLREQGFDMRLGGLLHAGKYLVLWEPIASARQSTEESLYAVAQYRNQSVQALLREINPRWRKGFPSSAALSEHDEWLIRVPWGAEFVAHISYGGSDDGYMILIPPDSESGDCGGIEESVWGDCFYWPCDGNANRVRWPVDAEGNML